MKRPGKDLCNTVYVSLSNWHLVHSCSKQQQQYVSIDDANYHATYIFQEKMVTYYSRTLCAPKRPKSEMWRMNLFLVNHSWIFWAPNMTIKSNESRFSLHKKWFCSFSLLVNQWSSWRRSSLWLVHWQKRLSQLSFINRQMQIFTKKRMKNNYWNVQFLCMMNRSLFGELLSYFELDGLYKFCVFFDYSFTVEFGELCVLKIKRTLRTVPIKRSQL